MESADICVMEGNADFYGIGIRLGLYAQSITTLLVTLFTQEEEGLNRTLNLLLQLAIFAGTLLLTQTGDIHAFEVVIVFWLLVGSLSSLTGDGLMSIDSFSGVCRLLFYLALSAYGSWFWFVGADTMQQPKCTEILFFGGSTIDGWFRTFGKAIAIIGLAVTSGMLVWGVTIYAKKRGKGNQRSSHRRAQTEITLMFLSIAMTVLSIVATEYVIRANHLSDVDDIFVVGQILAFLVGLFQLLNTLIPIFFKGRLWAPRCWLLFGRHLT
ncbi:uncharacterized protein F4822DRAFT_372353 [Hypoxylon trugodes]|uniref:uncharacterized protein n=1 Tax=Hypoxylon trugodes TaxID=326681 RepID=UPI002190A380|nr:uncharacterized protein F4822DRAFT_372353 [Hypoxylon trugodes]KAI1384745.1 hypothetical protein F4822DRAFT_372353 [Hypoxylon trugodes]